MCLWRWRSVSKNRRLLPLNTTGEYHIYAVIVNGRDGKRASVGINDKYCCVNTMNTSFPKTALLLENPFETIRENKKSRHGMTNAVRDRR